MNALFRRRREPEYVTVVSGLPRSGTSLMMRMLDEGGIPPITDGERSADDDNPRGYYEFERVKQLPKGDIAWVEQAQGKAVKVISALLVHLPSPYTYRVVFMRRAMSEILASQRKMLIRRNEDPDKIGDDVLAAMFDKHVAEAEAWMAGRTKNLEVIQMNYNELVQDPETHIPRLAEFFKGRLDQEKMMGAVEPGLYRNRG